MSAINDLKCMVRGVYDLQALRIQAALRLAANFRAKLGLIPKPEKEEDEEEALKVIERLKQSYKLLTAGIARNRTLPTQEGFVGDELISTYSEIVLVDQYLALEKQEAALFRRLEPVLESFPIYSSYLKHVRGVGPAMAGVLMTGFDIHKARYPSSFWMYAGLDVASDGRGRSRRKEHLVDREYTNKKGETDIRASVTYNPWVKTKLTGVLAGCFMRSASPWREVYDGYKNRLLTDPSREKVTLVQWKKRHAAGENVMNLWPPGRINNASKRYMIKMFLVEYWTRWREIEGLPITPTYQEAKLGHIHREAAE